MTIAGTPRTIWGWAWRGAVLALLALTLAILASNYSFRHPSRAEFEARIVRSIDASTNWIVDHPNFGNWALMFMVSDMERMSGDRRLKAMLERYRQSKFINNPKDPLSRVWVRMFDSTAEIPTIDALSVPANDVHEQLWDAYAVAPDHVLISPAEHESMFSRTRYFWGRRHHQLLALDLYRYYNGSTPSLDTTINYLAEKVARDALYDLRVNDSYPQRSAFVLFGNRPDLIRARWIERLLGYQQDDGHWSSCWYGWCKGIFEFRRSDPAPEHATIQAAWLLSMLKYRYPQWIAGHYASP